MSTIKVYHAPRELSSKLGSTYDNEEQCQLVRDNIDTFDQVLEVPFGDYTLDDFYRYTQNEDESWTNKFGFTARHRSTSVGDLFEVGDTIYMVASAGFTEFASLTPEQTTPKSIER